MNKTNKFSAVTTFDFKKHPYGIEMVNSFFMNWPNEIQLLAFLENASSIDDSKVRKKIIIYDYHKEIDEYQQFCKNFQHKVKLTDDFRFNAFRFAYKVFAIYNDLKKLDQDI